MPLISITRLRVRAWRFFPAFAWSAFRCIRQAQRPRGYLGGKTYADALLTFWTATAWADEPAMAAYRTAEPLEQAHRWMCQPSRPSRVEHPSPRHATMQLAPPASRDERYWPPA